MNLQLILASFSQPCWLNETSIMLRYQGQVVLTKAETQSLLNKVRAALETGDFETATNFLYVGFMLDEARFLPMLQKEGLLRITRYSYKADSLSSIIAALLNMKSVLSERVLDYLQSVSYLFSIASSLYKEYEKLKQWLASEREVGIKSALASLDFLFMRQATGFNMGDKNCQNSRNFLFFSVEELAEGFSSILALYSNEFKYLRENTTINREAISNGSYYNHLISAAHLAVFRQWEFQVDRMGYRLSKKEGSNEFILRPPYPEFLRAVEMGYIQSYKQRVLKPRKWVNEKDHPFEEIVEKLLHNLEEEGFITLVKEPRERYCFNYPEPILTMIAQIGEFFREEKVVLQGACRDLMTPIDRLFDSNIDNGLTFRDLFLVSRLMQLLRSIMAAKLLPEAAVVARMGVVFESLIPAFDRNKLIGLLSTAVRKEKAEIIIDMLTTDMSGHIDIQYRPLLSFGKAILFPTNIFSNSNVYRNSLIVLGKRLYEDGTIDPLGESLHRAFEAKGATPKQRVSYSWEGEKGELDILVLFGSLLFVFECKNSLLPTGFHELMTSLDYIYTAASQLDRFKLSFTDIEFRKKLAAETGMAIDSETRLVTGILLSNRMFMGLRVHGHPVRGNYELEHFIAEGTIAAGEDIHCFWLGSSFTGDDLRRFLAEDITYRPQWDAMKGFTAKYLLDGCVVDVERMNLDMVTLSDLLGFKLAKQRLLEQQEKYSK